MILKVLCRCCCLLLYFDNLLVLSIAFRLAVVSRALWTRFSDFVVAIATFVIDCCSSSISVSGMALFSERICSCVGARAALRCSRRALAVSCAHRTAVFLRLSSGKAARHCVDECFLMHEQKLLELLEFVVRAVVEKAS